MGGMFTLNDGSQLEFHNVIITGGLAIGIANVGGVVKIWDGSLGIYDSKLTDNYAEFLGGVIGGGEDTEIANSLFVNNLAEDSGGVMYGGGLTTTCARFDSNEATLVLGGALAIYGGGIIHSSSFTGNTAGETGHQIFNYDGENAIDASENWWAIPPTPPQIDGNIDVSSPLGSDPTSTYANEDYYASSPCTMSIPVPLPGLICPQGFTYSITSLDECSTPTPTSTPVGVYHVSCDLLVPANVRNYPAGQTIPTPQIDGRVVLALPAGTIVTVHELRLARDGINWARITPYGWLNNHDTLWIRTKQPDNVTDILVSGSPSTCSVATPDFSQPTQPPPTPSFPIGTPGCLSGRDCPHVSTITDVDLVSFILACEAGAAVPIPAPGSIEDAISNGHVVYNRMDSGLYAGTARQVVSQSGQWQPYSEGCNSSLGLANLASIHADIRNAAQELVNGDTSSDLPINPLVDWMGLYTFGVFNTNHPGTPPAVPIMLTPYCPSGTTQAMNVFLGIASFADGARANASVFFSDGPGCIFP